METGDRPSRDGDGISDDGYRRKGERPSEEAIRSRLIDRRKAFDEAEAGRTLANRFRQQMRAGGSSVSWSRRALAPARTVSRLAAGLRNRPIIAFVLAASMSAVILVPLALSSYAPLPGEMPLPAATPSAPSTIAMQDEPSPPSVAASSSPQADLEPTETTDVRAPIAPRAPDGSMFETLESEEAAAIGAPSDRPDGAEQNATIAKSGETGSSPATDPNLLETASLRKVAPALPERAADGTGGAADPAGATRIDPVAAALALRLPEDVSGIVAAAPTTLDPATTGSISSAAAPTAPSHDATADAPGTALPGIETAGPAKSFITVSPSILIATSDEGGPASVSPSAAGVVETPSATDGANADPAATGTPEAVTKGRATASVNLRAEPTNEGRIVAVLSKDEAVTVVSCQGWCEVQTASGQKGYVYEKFITRGSEG
ncbi:SH3 domain-containing protein [Jiella pacifica]|uniref:SH3 domain-containing protein n=1 Tax=Jiella pacifica TaxID=2696469 RepID=A0A6N9T5F0_9HYPH|nr:SH3 domain-containing protein [Jiella pacifica]NDW05019.1 SH3 domain-containing protein [Jiella pacifica]